MKKAILFLLVVTVVVACWLISPDPAFAGPGGKIASAAFRTSWGKIVLAALVIIFLPLILYVWAKESLAVKRTLRDLHSLAQVSEQFDWLQLKERIADAFYRVHAAWHKEEMAEASEWMTSWYWQNQQLVFLDQWERDGLVNHCRVKQITSIKPLFVRYRDSGGSVEGSRIVVSISAKMEDYLANRQTGKVVEGKKGFSDVERIWTFVHERGSWVVANIEEGSMSLHYAKLTNEVPAVASLETSAKAA